MIVDKLLNTLRDSTDKKYCLIQSGRLASYQKKYPEIVFIDIEKESFYDVSDHVLKPIKGIHFEKIYIPVTGVKAYNFGNVMEIIVELDYNILSFFYSNGESHEISKINRFHEYLCKKYIQVISYLYTGDKG